MPTISSIPPELLRHILTANLNYEERDDLRCLLLQTSLVCRAWRDISKDLLLYEVVMLGDQKMVEGYTKQLRKQKGNKQIRWLTVSSRGMLEKVRNPKCRVTGIERLELWMGKYVNGSLDGGVLDFTTTLGIYAPLLGSFTSPLPATLPLTCLWLLSWRLVPRAILEPLLAAAPNLTRLRLAWDEVDGYSDALMTIAPQLQHLELDNPSPHTLKYDGGGEPLVLSTFLSSCTSLQSLHLFETPEDHLPEIMRYIPTKLVVLAHSIGYQAEYCCGGGEEHCENYEPLLRILQECKALKELKRWRVGWLEGDYEGDQRLLKDREEWKAACEAEGIEVRDMERRLTD